MCDGRNDYVEIIVKFRVNVGDVNMAIYDSQFMGNDSHRSLLKYVRWIAQEEGLLGIVEDGYEITEVKHCPQH